MKVMNATEALVGFTSWLSTMKSTISFGSQIDPTDTSRLLARFIEINNLPGVTKDFPDNRVNPVIGGVETEDNYRAMEAPEETREVIREMLRCFCYVYDDVGPSMLDTDAGGWYSACKAASIQLPDGDVWKDQFTIRTLLIRKQS